MYIHTFAVQTKITNTTTMKKLLIFSALILSQAAVYAQKTTAKTVTKTVIPAGPSTWSVDPVHSTVKFSVSHLTISTVEGKFKEFSGTINTPGADFNNAKITFDVDVNSVTTDNDMRDKHLKSDDFFNAEKYPKMTFVSTSFKKLKGNIYTLEGNMTIRNVTKKVKFAVLYGGTVVDPYGNTKAGFKASGKISRAAYGLKWNQMTEAGGTIVGDEVDMTLELEFAKAKS